MLKLLSIIKINIMKKATFLLFIIFSFNAFSQNFLSNKSYIKSSYKSNRIDSLINIFFSEVNPDSIKSTIKELQCFGTRYLLAPNRKQIAVWLQNKFISLGYPNTVLDSFIMITNLPNNPSNDTTMQYNVIATINGSINPNNVYIIGGHYDDITNTFPIINAPGADDDASGVASTIEIARVINKMGLTPNSTFKFVAFAGEEAMVLYSDTYGSQHYVEQSISNNENIIFFITNEIIAHNTDSTN